MIIENAKKEDVCTLKQIWKEIFKDPDDYIDLFFDKKMNLEYTFVARKDGEIVSTAYLINSPLVTDDSKIIPAFYMCGISTSQQARGKG
ncbi:MAG: GNAT family N-acetyltransferase, partial [Clostridia bacterium]|nr:GNAT family N-acetyltransferase [Clostridia bacterium]